MAKRVHPCTDPRGNRLRRRQARRLRAMRLRVVSGESISFPAWLHLSRCGWVLCRQANLPTLMSNLDIHRHEPAMFRSIVEHTYRFRARFPLPVRHRTTLRGGIILSAVVTASLLALAVMYAPLSARANLERCLRSLADEPTEHGKTDSRESTSRAIERCIN